MHEVSGRLRFTPEPLPHFRLLAELGVQHFDHQRATERPTCSA